VTKITFHAKPREAFDAANARQYFDALARANATLERAATALVGIAHGSDPEQMRAAALDALGWFDKESAE
jgi:hypothetical protein